MRCAITPNAALTLHINFCLPISHIFTRLWFIVLEFERYAFSEEQAESVIVSCLA